MKNKVILIILDGLANEIAIQTLGCVHGFIEAGIARHKSIQCELPSLSRPLYETILTGKPPYQSGIYTNRINRLSKEKSIFHRCREAELTTAAAAYHWISELYNQSPYDLLKQRHQHDSSKAIQHGIFYNQDEYPDEAVFQDAEYLRATFDPSFLLIHPMNIDDAGHKFGVDSLSYFRAARNVDDIMGNFIPEWIALDYQIIITADHGMNVDKTHGGMADIERIVPLYCIGKQAQTLCPEIIQQTEIMQFCQKLLGIA